MAKTKINKNQLANTFVESVNEIKPDSTGDVLITNVATADNLTSPDNINDYGTFIFRTSAGTKSIATDKDSADPTYLSEATLMSIQGEIKNPRKAANNIVDSYVPSATPRVTVEVDATLFGALSFVNQTSGSYTLTFDGTNWNYDNDGTSVIVNLETAGITLTGTPANGDSMVINYTYDTYTDPETQEPVTNEYANATYTAEDRLTFTVVEATFAQGVNEVVGTYTFSFNGNRWLLDETVLTIEQLSSMYGITYTGTAIDGDILSVTYNGSMEVATPTSFVTSSFNQFNPANVISNAKIDDSGNIVPESGSSVAFIKGVGGLNNKYGSRHGDYTVYDENGSLVKVGWRKNNPSVLLTTVGTLTNNNGVVSGFTLSNYLKSTSNFPNDIAINGCVLQCKFTVDEMPTTGTSEQILGVFFRGSADGFRVSSNGRIIWVVFGSQLSLQSDTNIVQVGNSYVVKGIISSGNVYLYFGTNENNLQLIASALIPEVTLENQRVVAFGLPATLNADAFINGSIDMNSTYIKVDGQTWFDGKVLTTPESVITSDTDLNIGVYTDTEVAPVDQIKWITFDNDGYICVSLTNTAKLCVHPEWSGYMDTVYQKYIAPVTWENNPLVTVVGNDNSTPKRRKPSIINIPTQGIDTDKLTQTPIAFEDISCKDYLARVGLVYDEIRFEDHRYIKRIEREQYSQARVTELENEGAQFIYDSNFIYWVLPQPKTYIINCTIDSQENVPVLDTNQSGQYMVCDFGTEEFMGTEVAVLGNFLYGNNLVDKLRTDVLTKSAQSLSMEQKQQVWQNIGTLPLYNYSVTVPSNANLVITLDDVHTLYDLTPDTDITSITIDDSHLSEKDNAWYTFYLHINMDNPTNTAYNFPWESTQNIKWGNTSPTMTAAVHYLLSFTKPKGSNVFVANQCYSWQEE